MTDEKVYGLMENSTYCWRVRYRDRELNWSEWSEPASFATGVSQISANLIANSGAEDGIIQWTEIEGSLEALTDDECNGISPHSGEKYFAVGGVCLDNSYGKAVQDVNVSTFLDSINT